MNGRPKLGSLLCNPAQCRNSWDELSTGHLNDLLKCNKKGCSVMMLHGACEKGQHGRGTLLTASNPPQSIKMIEKENHLRVC